MFFIQNALLGGNCLNIDFKPKFYGLVYRVIGV